MRVGVSRAIVRLHASRALVVIGIAVHKLGYQLLYQKLHDGLSTLVCLIEVADQVSRMHGGATEHTGLPQHHPVSLSCPEIMQGSFCQSAFKHKPLRAVQGL